MGVTDKELTQGPEGAKAVMEAVGSLVGMAAKEAKVAMEGLALQVVMVEMAAMVENQRDHPSQPPPVRVSRGRKSSACFGQSCASESFLRPSGVNQPPQHRHRNLISHRFGDSRQSLNLPK